MKVATKFVSPLNQEQRQALEQLSQADPSKRVRIRAQGILLSADGSTIDDIARTHHVNRDTVSSWIDRWEEFGVDGLRDKPRSGGPHKLNDEEKHIAKELLQSHPNYPREILALLREKTGKTISYSTLRRLSIELGVHDRFLRPTPEDFKEMDWFKETVQEIESIRNPSPGNR
jgi:transposase